MVVRHYRSVLLACTAFIMLSHATPSMAQTASADQATDAEGATPLKKLSTKSSRVGVADTPLATTTSAETITNKQITSIEDLGRVVEPGVGFNRTNGSVNIRGLEGSRVLTTIDGVPIPYLSDATRSASGGVDSFDFSSLSAVDVVKGGDSSRAGPGALGGVLALRTLEPEDLIAEGRTWGGVAKLVYDSADNSFSTNAAVGSQFGNTAVLFQGGYKKGHERETNGTVDTYGATRTVADPTDYDQHNMLFKVRHHAEGGHMFGVTAERFRKDNDTDPRTLLSATGNYRPNNYDAFTATDRDRVSLDYAFESESDDSLFDTVAASFYWQDQRKALGYQAYRFTSVVGPITRNNSLEEETFGLIGNAQKTLGNHQITFGWDLATSTTDQYSAGTDACTKPPVGTCLNLHTNQADTPEVDGQRIGFYIDDKISIGNDGFAVTPGVRFDWVDFDPQMTPEFAANYNKPALPAAFSDTAISPKLRFSQEVNDGLELYAQWAMGFRAPTAGELYSVFGGQGTYLRLGNPDLKSETSNSFDIGANFGDDDAGGRISLFYNRYKNFIDIKTLSVAEAAAVGINRALFPQGVTRGVNLDRARIYGVELSGHKRFDNGFGVRAGLSFQDGKDLSSGAFLQSVLPFKGALGLDYDAGFWGVSLDWIGARGGKGNDIISQGSRQYFAAPGYGIVDLTGWWEPEQVPGLKVNAGIYNVFDKTYYDYSTARQSGNQPNAYYSEPGRTFKVSLTQKF
ncbi:TonB-dependent hemoglobin/transferrin/lactoferrin family receptor [Pararhizobium sp.]|uniref:TonB-dependent hemoglobin/transferrin/lactoferrin family receptor n=1 Tax=Pararhizobium sp. TaxID=1977563 RepID=UPI00271C79DF|nr:TonB-dependent hemoglobin/transferrin/lactoferrin family receptor [Pararhizobium sp.]MDO9414850.1 TonB-dependent hemoglobin/transferrin/lactoferrin family receptor [Pararhizobium sp.]